MKITIKKIYQQTTLTILLVIISMTSLYAQLPTAQEIAAEMGIGWNMGNTLEAIGGETAWGGAYTTQKLIDSVKAAGFSSVRLPCAWFSHSDTVTSEIDAEWMARVKEIVDYCMNDSLYVILNIHWDNGWLENRVNAANQEIVNQRQHAYWTQIATTFRDYDEHLLFAGANEPNVEYSTTMPILMSYHQTFVDAVRATGGNNSSRTLVIQGPSTDIEKTNRMMNELPTDTIPDRQMVEVHYYTPYQFTLMNEDASWGKMFYYWGRGYHSTTDVTRNATWGEENDVERLFDLMQKKFTDKGIPVIMGEFHAMKRKNLTGDNLALHIASREYFHRYVSNSALRHGMVPVYWDLNYDLFNRSTGEVLDPGLLNALIDTTLATKVGESDVTPSDYYLGQNYPNPFNPNTRIDYQLPAGDFVKLDVYDVLGKKVDTLVSNYQYPGKYSVQFNAANLPNGVYFYRLDTGMFQDTKKLLVLK